LEQEENVMETAVYQGIGRRIRFARESLGLSQEELAQRLGFRSPTAISYFETGLRKVGIYDLQRIAEILGRPLNYFLEGASVSEETPLVKLRAQAVEPAARQTLDEFVVFAERHGLATSGHLPVHVRESPRAAAEYALTQAGVTKPPVSASRVALALGVPVFEWDFPDEISGAFVCHADTVAIAVNRMHPGTRQRFTIAHELGHWMFARDQGLFVDLLSRELMPMLDPQSDQAEADEGQQEMKANWFAADLLMPAQWIHTDVHAHGPNLGFLSRRYDVSQQAMWYRLLSLKLVPSDRPD
jgi:Zn-dependent peptidase ImmA (M78 family)/transcriptional regulator with XRE-family HTH domain